MSKQDDNGDNAISVEYLMGVWEDNDENKSEEAKVRVTIYYLRNAIATLYL